MNKNYITLGTSGSAALNDKGNSNISTMFSCLAAWQKKAFMVLLFAITIFSGQQSIAQSTANYTFATNATGSLALLSDGTTAVDMSTGTTQLHGAGADENASAVTNIGFNFVFMGNSYTQFSASSNGLLSLGSTQVASNVYLASGGSTTTPRIAAIASDAITASAADGGGVTSKLIGTAPNRCLVVQWVEYLWYQSTALATFQVRLYETTGIVEFVYGSMPAGATTFSGSTGFSVGTTTGLLASVTTSTNGNSTSTFASNSYTSGTNIANLNSSANGSRRVYRYTPPSTSTLAAPTATSVTAVTGTGMILNWSAASPTTSIIRYAVLSSTDNVNFTQVATVALGTNTYTASSLVPGLTYYFKVRSASEGGFSTTSADFTETTTSTSYTWNGSTSTDFQVATNWTPSRSAQTTADVLIFDGTTSTVSNVPTQAIGQIRLINNATVTLRTSAANTLTTSGLTIASGSTLNLDSTNTIGLTLASGGVGTIAGTFNISNTNATYTTTGNTAVASTGIINNSGTISGGTTTTLTFAASSVYNHLRDGGVIPSGTYNATSTINVTGIIGTTPSASGGVGNFVWNCPNQTVAATLTSGLTSVSGTATITNTGVGTFTFGSPTLTIAGLYTIGSAANVIGGGTINCNGGFTMVAGALLSGTSTTTFNIGTGSNLTLNSGATISATSGQTFVMNGTGAQNATMACTISGSVNLTIAATSNTTLVGTDINVNLNNLTINATSTASGTLATSAGQTLTVNATATIGTGAFNGTLSGAANLNVTANGSLVINGTGPAIQSGGAAVGLSGTVAVASGNITLSGTSGTTAQTLGSNFPTPLTIGTVTLNNATAGGAFAIDKDVTLNNFTLTASPGFTTVNSGITLTVNGLTAITPATAGIMVVTGNFVQDFVAGKVSTITFNATATMTGAGKFTINSGATLSTANTAGITASGATGSVQTTTRNFDTGANYTFSGGATGNGLPATVAGNVTLSSSTCTITSSTTFNGQLNASVGVVVNAGTTTTIGATGIATFSSVTGQVAGTTGTFNTTSGATIITNTSGAFGIFPAAAAASGLFAVNTLNFASGTNLTFNGTTALTTLGARAPATLGTGRFTHNGSGGITLASALSVGALTLSSTGNIVTTSTNLLTVTGNAANSIVRSVTSATNGFVSGPLAITYAASLSGGTYLYPIGKTTVYEGFELINPTFSSAGAYTIRMESFLTAPAGASVTAPLTGSPAGFYWEAAVSGAGSLTSVGNVRVTHGSITTAQKLGQATAVAGPYTSIGGTYTSGVGSVGLLSGGTIGTFDAGRFFCVATGAASGTFTAGTFAVGPGTYSGYDGSYFSITSALAAMAETTALGGAVTLELQADYVSSVEAYPLNVTGGVPTTAVNTVTIRPAAGVSSVINFNPAGGINTTALFDFNGGKNFIIDGRNGGTGTNRYITINNLGNAPAIRLINNAQNNNFKYLALASSNTSTTSGVVSFLNTTGTAAGDGNSNNTIDNCFIDAKGISPNGIYALGTTGLADNKSNIITNNRIYDFYLNGNTSNGINILGGNTLWSVGTAGNGNAIYQTVNRIPTIAATILRGITINNTSGNGFSVVGNTIGGAISGIAGSVFNIGSSTQINTLNNQVNGIVASVGTTTASSIQGNTIGNMNIFSSITSGTVSSFVGISVAAGLANIGDVSGNTIGSTSANNNINFTFRGTTTGAALLTGINTAFSGGNVNNNSVGGITTSADFALTTAVSFVGMNITGTTYTTAVQVNNNTIGSTSVANSIQHLSTAKMPATQAGLIFNGSTALAAAGATVNNNTVANISNATSFGYANNTIEGIRLSSTVVTAGPLSVTGNTVRNLTTSSNNSNLLSNAVSVCGISAFSSVTGTNTFTIGTNTVHSLSNNNNSTAPLAVTGLFFNSANTNTVVERNLLHSLSTGNNTSASQFGIVAAGSGAGATFRNNIVRLGINPDGTSNAVAAQILGIYKFTATAYNFWHNSVYVGGSSVASGAMNTAAFYKSATSGADVIQNNIFFNARSNASGTGKHYATSFASIAGLTAANVNFNDIFVNGTGGVLAANGATGYNTLKTWRTASTLDANSVSGNPQFIAANGSSSTIDLHIDAAVATQIEGSGMTGLTVTNDFDGTTRAGLTPVDMGAHAGNFTPQDVSPPSITLASLNNTSCTATRTLTSFATTTDASPINVTTAKPRVYFKKSTDADTFVDNTNATNGWKYSEASNAVAPYSFAIDASLINGGTVALGDIIQYFVVAQDVPTDAPNVGISNGLSFADTPASVDLTSAAFPLTGTPVSYTVIAGGLTGTVTIGATGTYTSLTGTAGLFNAINNSSLSGNLVANIIDASVTETAAVALNAVTYSSCVAGTTFTVTIKPNAAGTTLTGSVAGGGVIKLNGADNVIIDGSTSGGTDKSLTITNTNASTTSAVVWIGSASASNGANDITVKNTNIVGSGPTATFIGIFSGSGTTVGTAGLAVNNNVQITNNTLTKSQYGIVVAGFSTAQTGNVIASNVIGSDTATDYIGFTGIFASNNTGMLITDNSIFNIITAFTNPTGMLISTGVINSSILRNNISNIRYNSTAASGGKGLDINTGNAASNLTVANNMISRIRGDGANVLTAGSIVGLRIGGTTGGVKLYYNSVALNGASFAGNAAGTASAALYISSTATALDIRNNIFTTDLVNSNAAAAKTYAFYSAAANTAFSQLNYNDYYVSGTQGVLGFLGADRATLSALSTATGKDVNSVVGDPKFTSNSDLHIQTDVASIAESRAAAIAGFDTDFDNNPRFGNSSYAGTGTSQDMGADEFEGISASPTITNVSSLTICPNTTFTITGTNFTAGISAVAVGGTAVTSFTVDSETQITAVLGVGTSGVVSVTFGGAVYSGSQNITVPALPAATTITATEPKFCGTGGTTTLGVASYDGNLTYTWTALTPSATLSAATGQTVDATVTETSDFSLVVSKDGCGLLPVYYSVSVFALPTAQVTTTASGVCPETEATINSGLTADNFTASCINAPGALSTPPSSAVTLITGATVNTLYPQSTVSADDGGWADVPMGFNFNFFGATYSKVNVSTNGTLNFGAFANFDSSLYQFAPFPSTTNPANTIAAAARDLIFTAASGSTLKYWNEGYEPNRRFVVQYANVPTYATRANTGATLGTNNVEVVFYETVGTVEIRVVGATNGNGSTADSNNKFIGLQDPTKLIGATAPNCGVTPNTANYWNGVSNQIINPQAWRFDPADSYLTTWYNTPSGGSKTTLATGNNIFAQTVQPDVTTVYEIVYTNQTTGCTNAAGSAQVTMQILGEVAPSGVVAVSNFNPICGAAPISLSLDFSNAVNYSGNLDGLAFQWQSSIDDGSTWQNVLLATNATLTITPTQPTRYKCIISSCGGTAIDTAPVYVTFTNTLTGVVQPGPACGLVPSDIVLSGLIPNTTFSVSYNINGGTTKIVEVTSDASGNGTFGASVGAANDGKILTITKLDAGTCAQTIDANNTVTLVVSQSSVTTSPAVSNASISVLPNSTAVLSATPTVGTYTLRWYNALTGGTLLATSNSYTTPLLCTPGATLSYYVEETNGTCPGDRSLAVVNVQPLIVSDPANGLICSEGGSVQLSANVANTSNFTWTGSPLSSTTASVVTANPTATAQYGLSVGTSGVCGTITGTFNVGVIQGASFTPTASLTTACANQAVQLNAELSSSNFSVGSIPYTDVTVPSTGVTYLVTNGSTTTPNGVALTGGSLDDGGWNNISIGFTYNFFGADYTKLAVGTNGVLGLGNWTDFSTAGLGKYAYSVDGNGNVFPLASNPKNVIALMASDLIHSLSGTTGGTIRYWNEGIAPTRKFVIQYLGVRQYNNTNTYTFHCVLNETTGSVEIYVKNAPAGTGNNAPTIGLQNFDATIGATAPNRTKFTGAITTSEAWTFSPAADYQFEWKPSNNLSDADIVNPVFASGSAAGTYSYTVDATNPNTGCVTTKAAPSFTVVSLPAAPAATTAYNYCQNATATALTAAATGTNTLMWYTVATEGTGNATAPIPSTATVGTFSYWVAQKSSEGCIGDRTEIVITINALPSTPSVTTPVSYCQNAIAAPLTVTSSTVGNGLNWYYASSGGTANSAITPSTVTAGTNNYYVSEEDAAGCESTRAAITVSVNAPPAAPGVVGSNVTYCQNETAAALTATTAGAGYVLNWYTDATGGSSTASITPSTAAVGTTTYYVSQSNSNFATNCEGPRAMVTVTVNSLPTVFISAPSTTTCANTDPITFTATPSNAGTPSNYEWHVNDGTDTIVQTSASNQYTYSTPATGDDVYVIMTSVTSCSNNAITSNTVTLSGDPVTPSITINAVPPTNICPGGSVTFTSSIANGGASPTYNWYVDGVAQNVNSATFTYTPATGASVYATLQSGLGASCLTSTAAVSSNAVGITYKTATSIVSTPSSLLQCAGTTAQFSVSALGTNLTYQWLLNGNPITGNTTATSSTLIVNSITSSNAGNYTVTVTGECGVLTTTPAAALAVYDATSFVTQPVGQTVCATSNVTFNASATGGNGSYTYVWRKNGVVLSGQSSSSLVLNNVSSSSAGSYTVTVTGNCNNVVSAPAVLVVNAANSIITQPVGSTQCPGSTINLSVSAAGSGTLSYKWKFGTTSTNGTYITGATASSYSVASVTAANQGYYSVEVTSSTNCGTAVSNAVLVTINNTTVVTNQPAPLTVCEAGAASFSVSATGTNLTYQWKKGTAVIGGATSSTYAINPVQVNDGGSYAVVVSGSCGTITSNAAALTVNAKPVVDNNTVNSCTGTPFNGTPPSAPANTTYTWTTPTYSSPSVSGGSSQTSGIATISQTLTNISTATETATYTVTPIAASCAGNPFTLTVTADAIPSLSSTTTPAAICSGTSFSYTATSATTTATFEWTRDVVAGISTAASSGSSAVVSEVLTNTTAAPIFVDYVFTLKNGGCTKIATVTVKVNPTPVLSSASTAATCSNSAFTYTAASATAGTTYSWSRAAVAGISNGGNSNTTNPLTETLINTTAAAVAVTYGFTLTANTCSSTVQNVTVTVNPLPSLSSATTGTTCGGNLYTYNATTATGGTAFSWSRAAVTGISNAAGTGTGNLSETLNSTSALPVNVVYAYTLTANTCSKVTNVTVTVNPRPTIAAKTAAICISGSFSITPVHGTDVVPAGTTYSWSAPVVTGGVTGGAAGSGATSITGTLANPTASAQTATYTVTPTSGAAGSCAGSTFTVTVTISPTSVGGSVAGSTTVCTGTNSTTLTLSGHTGAITRWERSLDNFATAGTSISNTTTSLTASNLTATTYYRAVITSGACAAANSAVATVTVSPTSVGGTVAGSATVCTGTNSTTLTLSGHTGNITRWESSASSTFASGVSSIENTTDTLTATDLTATTYYRAVLTSGACPAVNSAIATVTVIPASVGGTVAGSTNVCTGTSSTTLTLSGHTGAVTGWESSLDNFATAGTSIANTTTSLVVTNITETTYYRAIITSSPCSAANSAVATLTVIPTSVGGSVAGSATVCTGTNSTVLTLSGHTGEITRWESSASSTFASGVTNIANTTDTLTATDLTGTTYYRAVVTSSPCSAANSEIATVTVTPASVGGTVAGSTTVCTGTNTATLTVSGYTGAITNWESSLDNFATAGTSIANTTDTLTATDLTETTYYRAVVTNSPCGSANSAIATVTVSPTSVGGTVAGSATVCAVSDSATLILSGHTGAVTRWESSISSDFSSAVTSINNTTTTLIVSGLPETTYYRAVVTSGACAAANSDTATVTVNPTPVIPAQTASICTGGTFTITPTNGVPTAATIVPSGTMYTWTVADNANVTGDVAEETPQTGISQTLTNGTNVPQQVVYTVTPTSGAVGSCVGATFTITVTVDPILTPTFTPVASICAGATLSALPTTSNNGYTGTWAPALNNAETTEYTFTPTAGECATTATLTITVVPYVTPSFTAVDPICSGATLAALPTTSNNGITGTWAPALNNTATTEYTFTPADGQCGTTTTLTITVNPNITPTFTAVAAICDGETLSALPTTSNNGYTGVWSPDLDNTATTEYTFTPTAGQCATTTTLTITVNPILTASVSIAITDGTQTSCVGTSVTFTATPTNGGTPSYQWKVNGNDAGTDSATFTSSTLANGDAVTVVMTSNATPCLANATATSNAINVTVNPTITASVSIASSCGASSATFTATPVNGGSDPVYQWKINGENVGTNSATFTTSDLADNDQVTVVMASSASPCLTNASVTSNTITVTLNPELAPSVSIAITAGTQASCTGTSVTFTATPTNGGEPAYQWYVGSTPVGTNSATFTSSTLADNDVVKVEMTSTAASCWLDPTVTSNTITVDVNPLNTITLTSASTSNNQSLCNPANFASITYATTAATGADFSGLPAGVTGSWSSDTVTISGTPTVNGTFNYTVTLTGGCGTVTATGTIGTFITTWTVTSGVGSWSNGAPTASVGAVISGNYAENVDLNACTLTVNNNAVVSVVAGKDFHIAGAVTVETGSSLTVEHNANLLQDGTANVNSGEITAKRVNSSMRRLDYTYWSSPTAKSDYSLKMFSPMTISPISLPAGGVTGASRFYYINETTNAFVAVEPTQTFFDDANIARGWSIRAPNNFPTNGTTATFNANWIGKPNSGNITIPVTYSGAGKGSNLIGNPYPSTIDTDAFLTYSPDNNVTFPNAGTIYFWSHSMQNAQGTANYASCNLSGKTAAAAGGPTPNGKIQVGQGFILKKVAASTVVFNNAMRAGNNEGQFFKTATIERNRIWLNLAVDTTPLNQIMVGYIEGTTLGFDDAYDGKLINSASSISSIIDNENYVIQARPTPFVNTDEVPLNFNATTAGSYTLSLDHVDGLFLGEQNVYLKDNLLNVTHDIKASAYTFTSDQGTFNNRFEVVYINSTLNISTPTFDANSVIVYKDDNKVLNINAGKVVMKNVKIYDVRGRLVYEKSNINTTTTVLKDLKAEQEVLLVKITSDDNKVVTKKVVF